MIASCVYSLPFAVQPIMSAFESVPKGELEAARTLGASPRDAFFSVALPQSMRGYLNAAVLSFAHTLGEFGVVLMVGAINTGDAMQGNVGSNIELEATARNLVMELNESFRTHDCRHRRLTTNIASRTRKANTSNVADN